MNANTRRAGSGRREAHPRQAGTPTTAPARLARPGRKTVAGLAGFGSAAALAGAGMAMLASPASVSSAAGPAHTAQPGVQEATLAAGIKSTVPPQPTLPGSNGTDASDVNTPTPPLVNQLNPGSQPNNPTVGAVGTVTFPFSPDLGVLPGTPSGSAAAKMDLPSMLGNLPAGGGGTFTVTSPQAGGFVNNFLGFLPIPQQQDLSSTVQQMRDTTGNGTLPFGNTAPGLAAGMQQNANDAFNALFGQGGQLDTVLGNTQLPAPAPFTDISNPFFNIPSNPALAPAGAGANFQDRFSGTPSAPSNPTNIPDNPALGGSSAPAGTGAAATPAAATQEGGSGTDGTGDGGTGGLAVVTTTPVTSPVSAPPDLPGTVPTQPVTLPAPAGADSSDLSNFGAQDSGVLYPSDASYSGYGGY